MSESLKQMTDKLLTLAGQMTAAEMAAVKGCIYGMIVAVDKRNEQEGAAVHQSTQATEWVHSRRSLPARGTPHP